jgi:proteasome lid subunit RPN8/RPN11
MGIFRRSKKNDKRPEKQRRRVWGIRKEVLELILEVSRESYPKEFAATLIAKKGIIEEINLLPGTISGGSMAILHTYMQPPDITLSVVGIVHSHPSGNFWPSGADTFFFSKYGHTHIIVGKPYNTGSWQAYDSNGNPVKLKVVE